MKILFKTRHPQAAEMREMAQQRLRFVLRRLSWLVPHATVRLSDLNGPRGGIDKRCQIELRTNGSGSAVITAVASNWHTAIENAVSRSTRILMRMWRRGREMRRPRRPTMAFETR